MGQTVGFHITCNKTYSTLFCVSGSRAVSKRHKTGAGGSAPFALRAVADALECKSSGPRFSMLGSATSKDDGPTPPRAGTDGGAKLRRLSKRQAPAIMDAVIPALEQTDTTGLASE